MGECVVAAHGLEGSIQSLLFAIALESPGTSILLGRRWVSVNRRKYVECPSGHKGKSKNDLNLNPSLFLI